MCVCVCVCCACVCVCVCVHWPVADRTYLIPFRIKVVINDLGLLLLPCGSRAEREKRRGKERRKEIINAHSMDHDSRL